MKVSNYYPRSILLLTGSFTFVFLMGEAVHELGHYLAHLILGHSGIGIHLDPWGGSRILGVNPLIHKGMGFSSAAGPILNLLVSALIVAVQALWTGKASRVDHPESAVIPGSALVLPLCLGIGYGYVFTAGAAALKAYPHQSENCCHEKDSGRSEI